VGILEIKGEKWRFHPQRLTSVRPFLIRDVELAQATDIDITNEKEVTNFLAAQVEELIQEAKETFQSDASPLIRVRVDVTGGVRLHPARFGQLFVGKVANPKDILLFKKKKMATVAGGTRMEQEDEAEDALHDTLRALNETNVGEIIRSLLKNKDKSLEFFPESEISEALQDFVDKNSKSAFNERITKWLKETHQLVLEQENLEADGDHIRDFIRQRTDQINLSWAEHQKAESQDQSMVDSKAHIVKKEVVAPQKEPEDDYLDETGDDGFLRDDPVPPRSPSPVRVKKEKGKTTTPRKTSRRSSVKSEPGSPEVLITPTPPRPKRATTKRKLEDTSPSASPQPRKQRKTSASTTVKSEKSAPTVISLSDSDDDTPQPTTTTKRRWGRGKK